MMTKLEIQKHFKDQCLLKRQFIPRGFRSSRVKWIRGGGAARRHGLDPWGSGRLSLWWACIGARADEVLRSRRACHLQSLRFVHSGLTCIKRRLIHVRHLRYWLALVQENLDHKVESGLFLLWRIHGPEVWNGRFRGGVQWYCCPRRAGANLSKYF